MDPCLVHLDFAKLNSQSLLLRGAEVSSLKVFLPGCRLSFISHLCSLERNHHDTPPQGEVYQEESSALYGCCRFSRTHSQPANFKWAKRGSLWRFTTPQKYYLQVLHKHLNIICKKLSAILWFSCFDNPNGSTLLF